MHVVRCLYVHHKGGVILSSTAFKAFELETFTCNTNRRESIEDGFLFLDGSANSRSNSIKSLKSILLFPA